MEINIQDLPQELVFNILSRLSVRLLLNCKCVCKSWFHIITDPRFVTNHYSVYNDPTQEEHLLVIRRPLISLNDACISILSWKNFNEYKGLYSSQILNPPDQFNFDHNDWFEIMGPCNGIYFLKGNPNVMMNPSLREFMVLPKSHLKFLNADLDDELLTHDYFGFGFDPKNNDYKVVVLKRFWPDEAYERERGHWEVELYSLNSNSWRKLDGTALSLLHDISSLSRVVYTYANNCYHRWGYVTEKGGKKGEIILAFDMVSELFRKIKVPKTCSSSEECFTFLGPFNDSTTIGVILSRWGGGAILCFDVWVMKDYQDEGSWIKQYSAGPIPGLFSLVGFYGNSRFLWIGKNENLVLYKADCGDTREFWVYGATGSIQATRYVESLASLHRGNKNRHQYFSCSLVPLLLEDHRE